MEDRAAWDLDLFRLVFIAMCMVNSWNLVYNPSPPADSWLHRALLDAVFVRVLWRIGEAKHRGDD